MGTVQRIWVPLLGLFLAGGCVFVFYGFTVDDALISARYASNIAGGGGHRFNVQGPVTDGVTPLPWPYLLAPFAQQGPLAALFAAKWLGLLGWLATAWVLAHRIFQLVGPRVSLGHLALLVGCCTPAVGAWAVAGMETGLVLALVTFATILGESKKCRLVSSVILGLASTLRPELLPFSLTLAVGAAWLDPPASKGQSLPVRPAMLLAHLSAAFVPFLIVVAVRSLVFGDPGPLALQAKPSDLRHGMIYVAATLIVAGPPLAVLAPWAWRKLPGWPKLLLLAFAVHAVCCVAVGGDWMPMSRLFAPVLPSLALVFVYIARVAALWSTLVRAALCLAGQIFVFLSVGGSAPRVHQDRLRLVRELETRIGPRDVVATLDIGWVGAAHRGIVVDLAGVTDPNVAALPGGHTSKRIPPELFDSRNVTHLLLLIDQVPGVTAETAWENCAMSRFVETRICQMETVRDGFLPRGEVRSTDRLSYLLLERRSRNDGIQ